MKNVLKAFGNLNQDRRSKVPHLIIALVAVIGFSMAACNDITKPEVQNQTPVATDYDVGNLSQTAGSVTAVTITPKSGKSTGTVSIKYDGIITIPQAVGTYAVTFDVAAATGWNAISGLSAGSLIVNPAGGSNQTPVATDYDVGNLSQTAGSVTAVTITPKSGKSSGEISIKYNGSATIPQTAGTYAVTFDVAAAAGWNAASGLSAGNLVVTDGSTSIDTTALDTVIQEAGIAKDGVVTASAASEVLTGKFWVTLSEWNAFDSVYKTAVETKTNPSSQSAVDTAKTNLQAAMATFIAAKKAGSAAAITLSGTITVKNNGQIVPYILLQAHNNDWSWKEEVRISLTAANTPWSIITKSLSSPTEIGFDIISYDNDKYEDMLFLTTVEGLTKTVHNTNISNIDINMDLNLITISGTLNFNYGKEIPSVRIDVNRKSDDVRLGGMDILKVVNNTPWSVMIPSQTVDTEVVFSIVGFDGPMPYQYDQLFALWGKDFGVKVRNQNITSIALNFITISGTVVNMAYNGSPVPIVDISIFEKSGEDWDWISATTLNSPSANAPWSIIIPAYTSDTEILVDINGKNNDDRELFSFWGIATRTVKNTNVSGIALNFITLSGTVSATYHGAVIPFVDIHVDRDDQGDYINGTTLKSPSANTPWSVLIPAFTSDTEVYINVGGFDEDEDELFWTGGTTSTVKDKNVSGIVLTVTE